MNPKEEEHIKKWRLILGKTADPEGDVALGSGEGEDMKGMDDVLEALYDSERRGGLGSSVPNVNRWLGDIRKYFPTPLVRIMQKDAIDKLGIQEMLLEPELLQDLEPDVHLIGTLLSLNKVMPEKTKATAKAVVRKLVEELQKKLQNPLREAIEGSLSRAVRNRRPKFNEIDWHKTIRVNLKNYQKEYKTIIPEHLIGYGKKGQALKHVILLVDQSGSMASSVVYASICGAVIASLRSVKTHLVVFDTSVVDLTRELSDPVELLFGTQLGGGTDISKALAYGETLTQNPNDTIFILISDLFEGGNKSEMLRRTAAIKAMGVQMICLLALSDEGSPAYDQEIAAQYSTMSIPTFACTPEQFPALLATAIKKESITNWMSRIGITSK